MYDSSVCVRGWYGSRTPTAQERGDCVGGGGSANFHFAPVVSTWTPALPAHSLARRRRLPSQRNYEFARSTARICSGPERVLKFEIATCHISSQIWKLDLGFV